MILLINFVCKFDVKVTVLFTSRNRVLERSTFLPAITDRRPGTLISVFSNAKQ